MTGYKQQKVPKWVPTIDSVPDWAMGLHPSRIDAIGRARLAFAEFPEMEPQRLDAEPILVARRTK